MRKIKRKRDNITLTLSKSTLMLVLGVGIGLLFGLTTGFMSGYLLTGSVSAIAVPGNTDGGNSVGADSPPQRIQVSIDDDPVLGNNDAPVTIIEFSDYECPFCQRFWSNTLPQIKENYIDTGKVKLVYRDFPLSFHAGAKPAAVAANCAGEQKQDFYWEAHDLIFGNFNEGITNDNLVTWLSGIEGLDTEALKSCMESGKYDNEIDKDFQDGVAAGVKGTPSFFIGNEEDGFVQVEGAQPYALIKQVIDNELNG